ncbi:Protein kinase domain-containing protein [Mycena sanguinolenta]|uniref:Protein kinase domain-containing protein n=1 Tax=Mycena sanguinolenta TaxID=230812 RepID=A0A8H6Y3S1_9AGAR|nr:Protein kinase domain-containing protein [Mycena sanguinolenta]
MVDHHLLLVPRFSVFLCAASACLSTRTRLDSVSGHKESMERLKMPEHLLAYAFSLPEQLSQRELDGIQDLIHQWERWDVLECLANYLAVMKSLFVILKDALMRNSHKTSHAVAEETAQVWTRDIHALHDTLVSILHEPESCTNFLACRGELAQQLLDLLQDLLDSFPESSSRPRLSKALERLSRVSGLYPTCFPLTGLLQKVGQQVAGGAFGDIWKGLVRGQSVSVKMMRVFQDTDIKHALQEFGREALIWRQLSHPNVLPFFGLYYLKNRLCLVSPWMSNGHLTQFLENASPDTDRVSLMLDVAMGLEYLHEKRIVHGDLKGTNILVTPSLRACVADFGLASIADTMSGRLTHSSLTKGGTTRYQAPELLATDIPNNFGSDVYAFGCVCYEISTGKVPFHEIPREVTVGIKVLDGLRPLRPETIPISDNIWSLIQGCWKEEPGDRPSMSQVVQRFVGPAIGAKVVESAADWDETFSCRSRRAFREWPLLPSIPAIERRLFGQDIFEGEHYSFMYEIQAINQVQHVQAVFQTDCKGQLFVGYVFNPDIHRPSAAYADRHNSVILSGILSEMGGMESMPPNLPVDPHLISSLDLIPISPEYTGAKIGEGGARGTYPNHDDDNGSEDSSELAEVEGMLIDLEPLLAPSTDDMDKEKNDPSSARAKRPVPKLKLMCECATEPCTRCLALARPSVNMNVPPVRHSLQFLILE